MILKRLLLTILALVLPASTIGCITGVTPYVTPVITAEDGSVIDYFYFIFEEAAWFNYEEYWDPQQDPNIFVTHFDTRNNIIGRSRGDHTFGYETISKKYYMPQERLQELYDDIIKYDIKSYSGPGVIGNRREETGAQNYFIRLTFRLDGRVYIVTSDDTASSVWPPFLGVYGLPEEYHNLCIFQNKLFGYYYADTDEFRSFPEGNWGLSRFDY